MLYSKIAQSRLSRADHLAAASMIALLAAMPVTAIAADAQQAQGSPVEEIVITGSRIIRDGYEAPTPLTVIDSAALAQQQTTSNIAETINTMPVFAGGMTPSQGVGSPSAQQGGLNTMSLRGMGASRTLVLLDGQRSVGSQTAGVVDVNNFPQQLISRVDVVTGGASAVYGSDAVSGVVNFILDKQFTGVKGEVSGGLTTYGDDGNYRIALAAGMPFANGRGHILLSGELNKKYGIFYGVGNRDWARSGIGILTNPAYGTGAGQSTSVPEYLVRNDVGFSAATKGGMIYSGPLKGIAFGQGGLPYRFNYGPLVSGIYMSGGDWASTMVRADYISLDPVASRKNAFFRAAYDVSDNVNVYIQIAWNSTFDDNWGFPAYQAGNGPTILSGNPFIPASVQTQMTALGVTSFQLGTMNLDRPIIGSRSTRQVNRNVIGASGKFDAFATPWSWNAYFQNGYTRISFNSTGVARKSRFTEAIDAVRDPVTGAVECRSKLNNPSSTCSPWNPMGLGVNTQAGLDYILGGNGGVAHVNQKPSQNVFSGSVTGEPFNNWAGPVSVALSAEHRQEKAVSKPDPVAILGDWWAGNYQPLDAKYSVTEGAIETVVPLAKGTSFADNWDLSAAFRGTSYSTSGYVSTWKVGTTYAPIPDIKLRVTRSRDIRAPNLDDLYAFQVAGFFTALDQQTNSSPTFQLYRNGNPNLRPEKADTTDIGIVLAPTFLPGFTASVDWWDIKMKDAIANPGLSDILRFCFEGRTEYCGNITRTNGIVTGLIQSPFNLAQLNTRGIDFEGSYRMPLSDISGGMNGDISIHSNATLYLKSYTNNGLTTPTDNAGQNGTSTAPPSWRLTTTLSYTLDSLTTALTARAVSAGTLDNSWVTCSSGCPTSNATHRTIDNNHVPGAFYMDASINYGFDVGNTRMETFLNIRNVFNKDPALVAKSADQFGYVSPDTNVAMYDILGRVFRAGVRFKM